MTIKKYLAVLPVCLVLAIFSFSNAANTKKKNFAVSNPYEHIHWETIQRHKANLHAHTLQSDGYHKVKVVAEAYKRAGYSILSLTDHDWNWPNARLSWGLISEEEATPYPLGGLPENFPANTTWPWKNYGSPSPEALGMLGIQGGELTFRHHMGSYFSDYGVWYDRTGNRAPYGGIVDKTGREIFEDDQLADIKKKGGLAIINHPGIPAKFEWFERKSLDWYVDRFKNNSSDCLVGMEITNNTPETETYDEGLWDQLLARFMPGRPVWGFGNDDMHTFETGRKGDHGGGSKNTFTVFLLDTLTQASVREAMKNGSFYFCKSSRQSNLQFNDLDLFPSIQNIKIDENKGVISVEATNFDQIRWISSPVSLQPVEDYKKSDQPWPLGLLVHDGPTLNYKKMKGIKNYVRLELERKINGHSYRTFTNPIGITVKE
ncbi:hypothetical protein [Agriterribacter sp.]|uniref:PHP domain-containing protein n=1 Tax=Agriterribacter sp. TaxID=2821509 RepID=UPI002C48BCDB|nr:hypothetical protein [Agriterribacter sp.]HTN07421.1 hypothetical protein [Agriterribacter sp.]